MLRRAIILMMILMALMPVSAQDEEQCLGTLPSRLSTGSFARVRADEPNPVRAEATTNGRGLGRIPSGGIFWVHDGPICADGYRWWYAEYRGLNGWTPEGTDAEYWLEPVADEDAPILNIENLSSVIVFISQDRDSHSKIYITDLTGEVSVSLTPPDFNDYWFDVSPDFTQIAFLTYNDVDRGRSLGVMGFDGSFRRVFARVLPAGFAWSPDNNSFLLRLEEPDPAAPFESWYGNLYLMPSVGGEQTALTSGLVNRSPASWSPDGTQITYTEDGESDSLWIMEMATGEARQVLTMDAQLGPPLWSPDGTSIAFSATFSDGSNVFQYFVVDVDGSNLRQPIGANMAAIDFAWSPDGTQIAFSGRPDGDFEIYIVNADGSGMTQVTNNDACDVWVGWSPDGTQLVFVSSRDREESELCRGDVYVMNANGVNPRRLTDNGRHNYAPQWINIAPPLPPE